MGEQGFALNILKEIKFTPGGVFSKVLAKSSTYNYTLMCLGKGTDIDTHTSTKNGVVYVLCGKGTFILSDKEIVMEPGVAIFMPKDAPHSLHASGNLAILLCLTV